MTAHNAWINQGFDDRVFLLVGSIVSGEGGSILAQKISLEDLEQKANSDRFVSEKIVSAEVIEVAVKRENKRLESLAD